MVFLSNLDLFEEVSAYITKIQVILYRSIICKVQLKCLSIYQYISMVNIGIEAEESRIVSYRLNYSYLCCCSRCYRIPCCISIRTEIPDLIVKHVHILTIKLYYSLQVSIRRWCILYQSSVYISFLLDIKCKSCCKGIRIICPKRWRCLNYINFISICASLVKDYSITHICTVNIDKAHICRIT